MKHLVISIKTPRRALKDFVKAYRAAKAGKLTTPHYEISFDNKEDFNKFVRNIYILSDIITFKPKSVYELAKIVKMDVSNLNKIIMFMESVDAIELKTSVVSGRTVKTPVVHYDQIRFKLAA